MQAIEERFCLMNTQVACKILGPQADEALLAIQAELYRLEGLLSRYQRKSDISKINKAAGRKAVKVDQATFAVLKRAQQFSSLSDGLFSLLVGPLVDLWDYKKAKQKPDEAAIQKVLSLLDCTDLVLCDKDQSAFLPYKGQSIDLGAIGKGYAAECAMDTLIGFDISGACLSIGGNTVVRGKNAEGKLWRVGIQHPRKHDKLLGIVRTTEASVVTSGDYERFFVDRAGVTYHHILDPKTGCPSCSGIISSTVMHEDSLVADALSTTLFVSGLERGLSILAHFPSAKVVLVDKEHHLYISQTEGQSFEAFEEASVTILSPKNKGEHICFG